MSKIKVHTHSIHNTNNSLNRINHEVSDTSSKLSSLHVDYRISARRNISTRLANTKRATEEITAQLKALHLFIDTSTEQYNHAENRIRRMASREQNVFEKIIQAIKLSTPGIPGVLSALEIWEGRSPSTTKDENNRSSKQPKTDKENSITSRIKKADEKIKGYEQQIEELKKKQKDIEKEIKADLAGKRTENYEVDGKDAYERYLEVVDKIDKLKRQIRDEEAIQRDYTKYINNLEKYGEMKELERQTKEQLKEFGGPVVGDLLVEGFEHGADYIVIEGAAMFGLGYTGALTIDKHGNAYWSNNFGAGAGIGGSVQLGFLPNDGFELDESNLQDFIMGNDFGISLSTPLIGGSAAVNIDDDSLKYRETGFTVTVPSPGFDASVTTTKVFGDYGTIPLGNISDLPDLIQTISEKTGLSERKVTDLLRETKI